MAVSASKKKVFSKFTLAEAYKQLGLERLSAWAIDYTPISPTEAFQIHLQRLQAIDVFGIVTNGEGWKFYQLTPEGQVLATLLFSISGLNNILGQLHYIFQRCETNLTVQAV